MKLKWQSIPLGNLLTERTEQPVDADITSGRIKIIEKISFDSGSIKLRSNGLSKTKMILIYPGDLVISGINAMKGAIAIYDKNATTPIAATIHFTAYKPNSELIDIQFLWWILRSRDFQEMLLKNNPNGIKTEVKAKRLLPLPIVIPPLNEQKRIVKQIEEIYSQINEVKILNRAIIEEEKILCWSLLMHDKKNTLTSMRDLVKFRPPDIFVERDKKYQFAGVFSFGRGVFQATMKNGMDFAYERLTQLKTGDFVYPKLMAWEGAFGVVPPECNNFVVSPEFPVFEINKEMVLPEILDIYFRSPTVWSTVSNVSTGTNFRRRRLNPKDFLNMKIPLPSYKKQEFIKKIRDHTIELEKLHKNFTKEIDALLPSILDKAFKGEL